MHKPTLAAIAAFALLVFCPVAGARAGTTFAGFADIQHNTYDSDNEDGNFRASGELDVRHTTDIGTRLLFDLDILNVLNTSAEGDLPSGTATDGASDGAGVDVEQLAIMLPLVDTVHVTAGVQNAPFGREGQDAPDIPFAANGLLWHYVPSNIVGGVVALTPTNVVSVHLGYINDWTNPAPAETDAKQNGYLVTAAVVPMDGLTAAAGYVSNAAGTAGDMINLHARVDLVPGLGLAAEFQAADPAPGGGGFDSGWGLQVLHRTGGVTGALRYEAASFEGTAPDQTDLSAAVTYALSANDTLRLDWTGRDMDTAGSRDTVTLQLLHAF